MQVERSSVFGNREPMVLYHGSDKIVKEPTHGHGKPDNDYGAGFYTTPLYDRAVDWAKSMGDRQSAFVNKYTLDTSGLKVLYLDDYGVLAWIAEIMKHRIIKSEFFADFADDFIRMYSVDTTDADVIVGYRADDSYTDVIGAFCDGIINCDEVKRLFYKGSLGEQYFIKSERAFSKIKFESVDDVMATPVSDINAEANARNDVVRFLAQRKLDIVKRQPVQPITIIDALANQYRYEKEFDYYVMV